VLFNLAAKAHFHKLEDFSDEEWAAAHQDEVDLVFYLTRAAWPQVPQAVAGLDWEGRIVIDPTNDFDPSDLDRRTSSEVVADLVAPARVVKAATRSGRRARLRPPPSGRRTGDLPVR
jgi:predicted dinucleotide-binding enzyme